MANMVRWCFLFLPVVILGGFEAAQAATRQEHGEEVVGRQLETQVSRPTSGSARGIGEKTDENQELDAAKENEVDVSRDVVTLGGEGYMELRSRIKAGSNDDADSKDMELRSRTKAGSNDDADSEDMELR